MCWAWASVTKDNRLQSVCNFVITTIAGTDRWFYKQDEHIKDINTGLPIDGPASIPTKCLITGTPWKRSLLNLEACLHRLRQTS